ncbi:fibrinogen beta chain [Scyliorhinus torazame]|uniref:fibrinogen beta chain n=1 Tax=Scyliorhinus torazame TaxID=75743 RepID=UPI003B5C9ED0
MKWTLVLLFCITAAQAVVLDYDEDMDSDEPEVPAHGPPRGHRPDTTFTGGRHSTDNHRQTGRYGPNPTPSTSQSQKTDDKVLQSKGGCNHLNANFGVLCPNGCELRTALLKEDASMQLTIDNLTTDISHLYRSTIRIHEYVDKMDLEMQARKPQYSGNKNLVITHNTELETYFSAIKEKVKGPLPSAISNIRFLLDSLKKKLETLKKAVQTQVQFCEHPCTVTCNIPVVSGKECNDIYTKGGKKSQLYLIQPDSHKIPYRIYCDMVTEQGGWALIQNRQDGSVDFGRSWDAYKAGFGNIAFDVGKGFCDTPGEYWLGNDQISYLTKLENTELLFEMKDWENNKLTAEYGKFVVQNEANTYRLSVDRYFGNAGNTLMEGSKTLYGNNRTMTIHQNMMFSTYDRDNDKWLPGDLNKQCAREDGGGWWYNRCHSSNPNGRYYWGGNYTRQMAKHGTDDGIVWMDFKGSWYSMKEMSMKIRPVFTNIPNIPNPGLPGSPRATLEK